MLLTSLPFATRRADVVRAEQGLSLAADVMTLTRMTAEHHSCVMHRREPEVKDPDVRRTLERRVGRLGMLLEDMDALDAEEDAETPALFGPHGRWWRSFLQSAVPASPSFVADLETFARKMRTVRDTAQQTEGDGGSSSYSDYSDSDTSTTDSYDDSEGDDDNDESGSEENPSPAVSSARAGHGPPGRLPPVKRRLPMNRAAPVGMARRT